MLDDSAHLDIQTIMDHLSDPWWRLTSGVLYRIMAKSADDSDEDSPGLETAFVPNSMQLALLNNLHNRNIILKARQLGMTSVIALMALDTAMFNADQQVVIVAHTEDDATKIFRTKIRYAYERLPDPVRALFPLKKRTESSLIFEHNNSTIEVATSARGGTTQFLHVSEMGKISANTPGKSRELVTGSLPSVPQNGLCFIESTAEGQEGDFYELARRAQGKWRSAKTLTPMDYRFHFFAWWQAPEYCLTPEHTAQTVISMVDHEYFDDIESLMGCSLSMGQRAWYVSKRDEEFIHEPTLMWREFPSTPDECWKSSTEGKYLAKVMARAQADGRIASFPARPEIPINGFWDIGASDTQVCWLHQSYLGMDRFIAVRGGNGEGFLPYITWIDSFGLSVNAMYLPHDASHKVNGVEQTTSMISQLRKVRPSWDWRIVPRVSTIQHGIDLLKLRFANYCFDEEGCKEGLKHLPNYKRKWNTRLATWDNEPEHDEAGHWTDALRQHAQGYQPHSLAERNSAGRSSRDALRRRSVMTA
jgi:hypothetical protein